MDRLDHDIVQDLLPLYHDGVCSEKSRAAVEEHLKACEACRAALAAMGIAGETAFEKAGHLGCGSFHMALLDAVGGLSEKSIRERADIEEG